MDNRGNQPIETETLEDPGSDLTSKPQSVISADPPLKPFSNKGGGRFQRFNNLFTHINVYLMLFFMILVVAITFTYFSYANNKKNTDTSVKNQPLSQAALKDISNSDLTIGDAKQTLGVKSNTVFDGKVLVRDSLEVAGTIKVGGSLNLPGITVTGTSIFDQLQGNKLLIAGDASIQGQLNIQKSLIVSGGANFGGPISAPQITIQNLQLSNDLQLNRHIDAGGATPGKTDGDALGNGGTSSVGGTDTAGTITVNLGSSPPAGGCYITVNFAQKFNATPHISVTPVGNIAADLRFYVNRTSTSFTLCSNNNAAAGSSFIFDYVAID